MGIEECYSKILKNEGAVNSTKLKNTFLGMESTDHQNVENQRFEINQFCQNNPLFVDKWIDETVSGTKKVEDRELGKVLKKMETGDILICSELSRLGRNLLMIMGVLNECMNRDIQVWTIKDNYRLGSDINSKVLAFAFGLSAEIERNLI